MSGDEPRPRLATPGVANPCIAAIVLAAGQSSRFGSDKRLVPYSESGQSSVKNPSRTSLDSKEIPSGGDTLLSRSVRNLLPVVEILVVALKPMDRGHEAALLGELSNHCKVRLIYSEAAAEGLSGSLRDAVTALANKPVDGVLVALGDMPFVQQSTLTALIENWRAEKIVRPVIQTKESVRPGLDNGKPGNPVLFGRQWFDRLLACSGDAGARHVIRANPQALVTVPVTDTGILKDIDVPEDLKIDAI